MPNEYENHKHYETAYRAHTGTSFSPEKRAASYCSDFDQSISQLKSLDVPQAKIDKYESLWVNHMRAKGRCLSSMITGPANFPVRRNEKANNAERKAGETCFDYFEKLVKDIKKEEYYRKNPEARPVMSGDADAVERLEKQLAAVKTAHQTMVEANKILRKKPLDMEKLIEVMGNEKRAKVILEPDSFGDIGFPKYSLNNNRAKIKRLEDRISGLTRTKSKPTQEITVNGVRVVDNREDMRLELYFDGKPSPEMRAILKKNAFKWAPSKGVWQRQLTNNAMSAFKNFVKPEIEKLEEDR